MLKPLASDPASDPAAAAYDMLITRTKKRFQPVTFLGFLLGKNCFTTTNPPNIERLERRQRYLVVLDKGYRTAR